MKRSRDELASAVTDAEKAMKEAESTYYRLKREFQEHPDEKRQREEQEAIDVDQRLRKALPDSLYRVLVTGEAPLKYMYIGSTCGWAGSNPTNIFEMSIRFGAGSRSFEIPYEDDALDLDDVKDEGIVPVLPFCANAMKAWQRALAANKNDKAKALAALIVSAVIYTEDVEPYSTLLRDVYT
jgi:hypothetical protein